MGHLSLLHIRINTSVPLAPLFPQEATDHASKRPRGGTSGCPSLARARQERGRARRAARSLVLAALREPGPEVPTYTLVTTEASAPVREIHDRQPVVLEDEQVSAWMEQGDRAALAPSADDVLVGREG